MENFSYIKNKLRHTSFNEILRKFRLCNNYNFKILYIKLKKKNNRLKRKRYIIIR